ncbi:MAG: hypothetical protein Q8K55_12000 [Gemmatimonadaceae bacterium]|nr:hypothetical protein [Gemmatimonadaceae bacterium]
MKTLLSVVLAFVLFLSGCMRTVYVPTPTTTTASSFPAAPTLPAVGSYGAATGAGYYVDERPLKGMAFIDGNGYPRRWIGPNLVKIRNPTEHYNIVPLMDGRELVLLNQDVSVRFIPPGKEAWLFLPFDEMAPRATCEEHNFTFYGYLESQLVDLPLGVRPPLTEALADYGRSSCISPRDGGYVVEISPLCLAGRC